MSRRPSARTSSRTSARRLVGTVTAVTVLAGATWAGPAATATPDRPTARGLGDGPDVAAVEPVAGHPNRPAARPKLAAPAPARAVTWPQPGRAVVDLPAPTRAAADRLVRAGDLPVWVGRVAEDPAAEDPSTGLSAGAETSHLDVAALPRAKSRELGLLAPVFQITDRADDTTAEESAAAERVQVRVDISGFAGAVGGDWASRLRIVQLPACALTTPTVPACQKTTPVTTTAQLSRGVLTATLPLTAADTTAPGQLDAGVAQGGPGRPGLAMATLAETGTGGTVFSVEAAPSGPTGDWSASGLGPAATWQAGGSSGSFTWSYPLNTPPVAGGLTPNLALSYDSGSVDGRLSSTNNQPSWVGEGFSLQPGFIERSYVPCLRDMDGGNNTEKTGDLCWDDDLTSSNGANPDERLHLSFGSSSGELIKLASSPDGSAEFRLRDDDGTRIERVGQRGAAGEHYKLTTPDGTQYFFGRGHAQAGGEATQSAWKVPVFGNHDGEPCYQANDYPASQCRHAWRWNLDYVVDPHGNTLTYYWIPETNKYGRNLNNSVATYDRGGYLSRIDYGTRKGTENDTPAAASVSFKVEERCTPTEITPHEAGVSHPEMGCTAGELNEDTAHHWPDVPFDQICTSDTSCDNRFSPTFFTRKRLSSITTQVRDSGGTYTTVDRWTLTHDLPDPGDGGSAALWLAQIKQDHVANPVTFTKQIRPNRVDGVDGAEALSKLRVGGIIDEYGQHITVHYKDTDPACVPGVGDTLTNADLAANNRRCFPVMYTPPGQSDPDDKPHWFHKYVVEQITQDDGLSNVSTVATTYTYLGQPAWAKETSQAIRPKLRTWSQWRGYSKVATTVGDTGNGDDLYTRTTYYRGLNGDDDGDGDPNDGGKQVSVTDSTGTATTDHRRLAGLTRQVETFNGPPPAARVESTITDYQLPAAQQGTRSRDARRVLTEATHTTSPAADGATHHVDVSYEYDPHGMVTETDDRAWLEDASGGQTQVDRLCTTTEYAQNLDRWMLSLVATQETHSLACTVVDPAPEKTVAATRYYYDNKPLGSLGDPDKPADRDDPAGPGDLTKVEELTRDDAATPQWETTTADAVYDDYGRQTKSTDGLGRTTTTSYADAAAGGLAKTVTVTNPDPDGSGPLTKHVTVTDYDTGRGVPTRVVQPNGSKTRAKYDPLGRLTEVRMPGTPDSGAEPDISYAYAVANPGAGTGNAVTTTTLTPDGGTTSQTEIFDGLLRSRQTQVDSGHGGRVLTSTHYDSRGLVDEIKERVYQDKPVSTLLESITEDAPAETSYSYDGAGRPLGSSTVLIGESDQVTQLTYDGNQVNVVPPTGGTLTTTIADPRGRTIEKREYTDGKFAGPYVTTSYGYTPAGQLKTITDADNRWEYGYDLRGRQVTALDPDAGTTTNTYDAMGQLETTDHAGQVLGYEYDNLGRRTSILDGGLDGPPRATWTYDADEATKGLLSAVTRNLPNDGSYTTRVTGYDSANRPLGTETTLVADTDNALVPASLAGTYESSVTYNPDGSPATTTYGAAGPLAPEQLKHTYDSIGRPTTLTGSLGAYVLGAKWSSLGQLDQLALGNTYGTLAWHSFGYTQGSGRLASSQVDRQQESLYDERTVYSYDPAGNITQIATQVPNEDPAPGEKQYTSIDQQCFAYDGLRQLTEAWTPDGACDLQAASQASLAGVAPYWTSWTYDNATGNRLTQTHRTPDTEVTGTYTHQSATQPRPHALAEVSLTGDETGTRSFGYDARGNVTTRDDETLEWDPEGNLVGVTRPGWEQAAAYDADGRRILRTTTESTTTSEGAPAEVTTATLYLPEGTELTVTDNTDPAAEAAPATARRYYTFAGHTVAVREGNNRDEVATLLADHHGTAHYAITNATGALTVRRETPFGGPRGNQPTAWPGDRGFVGGTTDEDANLVQIGARPYDPTLGIFLAVDPILDPTDSRQINGYAYASNNPTSFSDPTGLIETAGLNGNTPEQHKQLMDHKARQNKPLGSVAHQTKLGLAPTVHDVTKGSTAPVGPLGTTSHQEKLGLAPPKPSPAEESSRLTESWKASVWSGGAVVGNTVGTQGTLIGELGYRPASAAAPAAVRLAGPGLGGAGAGLGQFIGDAQRDDLQLEQRGARIAAATAIGVGAAAVGTAAAAVVCTASVVCAVGVGFVAAVGLGIGANWRMDAWTDSSGRARSWFGDWFE